MDRQPSIRDNIALHVRLAARGSAEAARMLRDLHEACWPGGPHDRTEPLALSWLSLSGPELLIVETPVCRCAEGRCQVCN